MKKRLGLLILICILAVCGVLGFRLLKINAAGDVDLMAEVAEQKAVVCVFYANTYLLISKEGYVCGNKSEKPSDIPETTGLEFEKLAYGKKAEPKETSALSYVLKVALNLEKNDIDADRICYENHSVKVYADELEICLGKDKDTEDKIKDLGNFIDQIIGKRGVLSMQNGNANDYGYTFREK